MEIRIDREVNGTKETTIRRPDNNILWHIEDMLDMFVDMDKSYLVLVRTKHYTNIKIPDRKIYVYSELMVYLEELKDRLGKKHSSSYYGIDSIWVVIS